MPNLTRKQSEVLSHLIEKHRAGAPPPGLETLCGWLGVRSRGSMHRHVQALVSAGLVEPMGGQQRGIRLTPQASGQDEGVPLLGRIAAGRPIEAIEDPERIDVPAWLRGRGDCYALRVAGDSMIDNGILDGDWVVIESRSHARNGEVVVALIDCTEATLKRIEQRHDACVLIPANPALEPITYDPDRVQIQGVVVAQMRSYH